MALIICPECRQSISSQAEKCPHCGLPQSQFNQQQPNVGYVPNQPQMQYQQSYSDQQYVNTVRPIKPDSHTALAIISLLIGGLIFGIVSLIYSSKVDTLYASGNYTEAIAASNSAKTWAIIGIVLGVLSIVGGIIMFAGMLGSI